MLKIEWLRSTWEKAKEEFFGQSTSCKLNTKVLNCEQGNCLLSLPPALRKIGLCDNCIANCIINFWVEETTHKTLNIYQVNKSTKAAVILTNDMLRSLCTNGAQPFGPGAIQWLRSNPACQAQAPGACHHPLLPPWARVGSWRPVATTCQSPCTRIGPWSLGSLHQIVDQIWPSGWWLSTLSLYSCYLYYIYLYQVSWNTVQQLPAIRY